MQSFLPKIEIAVISKITSHPERPKGVEGPAVALLSKFQQIRPTEPHLHFASIQDHSVISRKTGHPERPKGVEGPAVALLGKLHDVEDRNQPSASLPISVFLK